MSGISSASLCRLPGAIVSVDPVSRVTFHLSRRSWTLQRGPGSRAAIAGCRLRANTARYVRMGPSADVWAGPERSFWASAR